MSTFADDTTDAELPSLRAGQSILPFGTPPSADGSGMTARTSLEAVSG